MCDSSVDEAFYWQVDKRYEPSHDVRSQLKFLEELDKLERKKHDDSEREVLLKAAKSRSKTEDPEQAKLKLKAKEVSTDWISRRLAL